MIERGTVTSTDEFGAYVALARLGISVGPLASYAGTVEAGNEVLVANVGPSSDDRVIIGAR
jgi:hypothetical protein